MTPLNILLVDGDAAFAEGMAEVLRENGHQVCIVCIARDSVSPLVLARSLRPDVVLIDPGPPHEDGCDLARALRQVVFKTTPIVVVAKLQEASLAVDEYVDLILSKPISPELLGGLVEYLCPRPRSTVAARPAC